jgi:cell division protein FtsQ
MNIKTRLKKIFTIIGWCLLGSAGMGLLVAAINAKNSSMCQGLVVEINGGSKALCLNKKDVVSLLGANGLTEIRNRKASSFDLLKMETLLRKNNWVRDVQLFFDNNQILKIRIQERQPVARLFTVGGNSYMIDSAGVQLSLPKGSFLNLPVFTGYPNELFELKKDSALNHQILHLAIFLNRDPFWSNQIQEVDIRPGKSFVMTPLIGNQVIEFGDGNDYENKFHRLYVFYREVMTQTGFDKYTGIKLAYDNQVVATRRQGVVSKADSIQARNNVLQMIRLAEKMETDTSKIRDVKPLEKNTMTEQNLQSYDLPEENESKNDTNYKH